MSTFTGALKEYSNLLIDMFDIKDVPHDRPLTFFLSHCHSDHMTGMDSPEFFNFLENSNSESTKTLIYASEISCKLLVNDEKYAHLEPYVKSVPLQEPTTISISQEDGKTYDVLVTLIPSGHCPGSVMFLFEGDGGTVLYTGDFRFLVGDIARISHLHTSDGKVKPLTSLYVDTTFCLPDVLHLPSRQESLDQILGLVEPWLNQSSDHVVWLNCKTRYGYEHIFVAIRKKLGLKVHVHKSKFENYKGIPEILDAVTPDGRSTRIHACLESPRSAASFRQVPCKCNPDGIEKVKVRRIKPSCWWYVLERKGRNGVFKIEDNSYRVCYSMHSSLTEVRDLVQHLNPERIYPNVVDKDRTSREIIELIQPSASEEQQEEEERRHVPLGQLKKSQPLGEAFKARVSNLDPDLLQDIEDEIHCGFKEQVSKNNLQSGDTSDSLEKMPLLNGAQGDDACCNAKDVVETCVLSRTENTHNKATDCEVVSKSVAMAESCSPQNSDATSSGFNVNELSQNEYKEVVLSDDLSDMASEKKKSFSKDECQASESPPQKRCKLDLDISENDEPFMLIDLTNDTDTNSSPSPPSSQESSSDVTPDLTPEKLEKPSYMHALSRVNLFKECITLDDNSDHQSSSEDGCCNGSDSTTSSSSSDNDTSAEKPCSKVSKNNRLLMQSVQGRKSFGSMIEELSAHPNTCTTTNSTSLEEMTPPRNDAEAPSDSDATPDKLFPQQSMIIRTKRLDNSLSGANDVPVITLDDS